MCAPVGTNVKCQKLLEEANLDSGLCWYICLHSYIERIRYWKYFF